MEMTMGNCSTYMKNESEMVKQLVDFLGDAMGSNFEIFFGGPCPLKSATINCTPLNNVNYSKVTPCMLVKAINSKTNELLFITLFTKDFVRTLINAVTGGDPTEIKTTFDDFDLGTAGEILGQIFNTFGSSISLSYSQTVAAINAEVMEFTSYNDISSLFNCTNGEMIVVCDGNIECDGFANFPVLITTPVSFIKKLAITFGVSVKEEPVPVSPVKQEETPQQPVKETTTENVMYQAPKTMLRPALTRTSMDLLMNIPLEISVQIGSTQRKIKDIVDFTNGTVIEINKPVSQPVDVLANNKLIAHGEIVVIEDNFGLRITEVLDMKELIASFENGD